VPKAKYALAFNEFYYRYSPGELLRFGCFVWPPFAWSNGIVGDLLGRSAGDRLFQLVELGEQLVVRDQILGTIEDLPISNRSRLVDNCISPLGVTIEPVLGIGLEESVGLQRRPGHIAEQREGEAHLLAPRLAGRHEVGADAQDLGIAAFELGQVKLESRDFARSGRSERADEPEQHHVLLAEVVRERNLLGGRRGQGEGGRLVADLHGRRREHRRACEERHHPDHNPRHVPHGTSPSRGEDHRPVSGCMNASASFPSHSRAPMARPTMTPLRSRTTVTGSQRTPYRRATSICGSRSVRILCPCFSRYGLTSFSPRPSMATKY